MRGVDVSTPWDNLTKEEQCILLGAAESATLLDVLAMWRPGLDYDIVSPAGDVPRMIDAARSLLRKNFIEVFVDLVRQSSDQALSLVSDERNWWTDDGPARMVELGDTPPGRAVLESAENIYSFRDHD
jgi:hypothetical protein